VKLSKHVAIVEFDELILTLINVLLTVRSRIYDDDDVNDNDDDDDDNSNNNNNNASVQFLLISVPSQQPNDQ